jgi:hypothetical protein
MSSPLLVQNWPHGVCAIRWVRKLRQPHHLGVALRLALQLPARRELVDVAVNVDLQQQSRMVARPAGHFGHDAREAQRLQVQLVDEHLDHPDRVLLGDVIFQIFREQRALPPVRPLDKPLHPGPPS